MARPSVRAALAALLALAACAPPSAPVPEAPPAAAIEAPAAAPPTDDGTAYGAPRPSVHRVGLLLPLSGPHAALGRGLFDAAALALFDRGAERIELVVADTGGDGEGARAAAAQVLAAGARLVLGPLFSPAVAAAAPLARQAGVGMVALSSDRAVARPGVFVMGVAPEQQVQRVVAHAAAAGHRRFAALVPANDFGRRMAAALAAAAQSHGGSAPPAVFYDPGGAGVETSAALLAATAPTALLVAETGPLLSRLAAWLGHHGIDPASTRLLGLAGWGDPMLAREPVLQGAWFATPPAAGSDWLAGRLRDSYGSEGVALAALAYDAVALAAALAESGDFSAAAIASEHGFAGAGGLFRFAADGSGERGLAVMEIAASGAVIADPAPTAFAAPP